MTRPLDRLRARVHGDAGTSLLEVIVGMTLMGIFMAMFTGATLMMTKTTNKVEAITIATGQTNKAFLALDKTVRYAAAISTPAKNATGSKDWYVELDTTNTGSEVCTQLRVDTASQQLQQRTWTVTGTGYAQLSAWSVLADGVTNGTAAAGSADQPFATLAAVSGAPSPFQQLQITLRSDAHAAGSSTSRARVSFTALNSNSASVPTVCQQVGRP